MAKNIYKTSTKERAANKLTLARTLLEKIVEGKLVDLTLAKKAIKDIDDLMKFFDKKMKTK